MNKNSAQCLNLPSTLFRAWIEYQLRTPKQRDRFICRLVRHLRIPHLSRSSVVYPCCDTGNATFARSPQKVALELDGSEVLRTAREIRKGTIAATCIGQSDDGRGVQVSVGRQQFRAQRQTAGQPSRLQAENFDADQAGQVTLS